MVSRRKILSRSRDDLTSHAIYQPQEDEDDVWYQKEKLFKVRIYGSVELLQIIVLLSVCLARNITDIH